MVNRLKNIGILSLLLLVSIAAFNLLPYVYAVDSTVFILPAPPTNAVAVNTTTTEIQLTWDASVTPAAGIDSYTVFYKETTDPIYPVLPQITRTDDLPNYSENITVTAGVIYDFIIYTNASSGGVSPEDCASCKATSSLLCGNGTIDVGEECDGVNLGGALCTDFGYVSGTLTCDAACQFAYGACNSSGGGGGGSNNEDNTNPNPGNSTSPVYSNTSPIIVTYSGASDAGGSGLSHVSLLVKKGTGPWQNAGLDSSGTSGTFEYVPGESPNAIYYFDLQAFDNQGNISPGASGNGDTNTTYDIELPLIETIDITDSVDGSPIPIVYEGATDVGISGLDRVELWFKQGEEGEWVDSELTQTTEDGSFSFEPDSEAGIFYFDLIAVDMAGNHSIEASEYETGYLYDTEPPTLTSIFVSTDSEAAPIVINYNGAVDVGPAGLKDVELWYKKEAEGTWLYSGLTSITEDGSFNFVPSAADGTYYFDLVLEDNLGNTSEEITGDGLVNVLYTTPPFAAVLTNLPDPTIEIGSVNIAVGGDDIVAYKYKVNEADYSQEILISTNIIFTDLAEGDYFLSVIGKNSLEQWQDISNPTDASWTVEFAEDVPPPIAEEGEDEEEEEEEEEEEGEEEGEGEGESEEEEGGEGEGEEEAETPSEGAGPTETPPVASGGDEPAETPAVTEDEEIPEQEPEITPPAPEIHYSAEEIEEKAEEVIEEKEVVVETPVTVALPESEEEVLSRIDQCKLEYSSLSFESGSLDSDSDGLSDKTECYGFTNPLLADTDQDGCSDGDEINQFGSNPLDNSDCKPEQKTIAVSSPQAGWLLSELEVSGLTHDSTSLVHLVVFPIVDGEMLKEERIKLGTVNQFDPSSIEGQYFFRFTPEKPLPDGITYDLVAIAVLADGETITSNPIRFTLDSSKATKTPIPLSIGDVIIDENVNLKNIEVKTTKNGKIEVTGESEYGAQVFATWESIVLASSVIADSALGEFSIESPKFLESGEDHEVTLFAVKTENGQKIKSKNVDMRFFVKKPGTFPYRIAILAALTLVAFALSTSTLNKKRLKGRKKPVARKKNKRRV